MSNNVDDEGVLQALLERLSEQRLPRLLEMKAKVERGEKLENFEVTSLADALDAARSIKPLLERHPQYQPLAVKVLNLCTEIASKAATNEA